MPQQLSTKTKEQVDEVIGAIKRDSTGKPLPPESSPIGPPPLTAFFVGVR